MKKATLWVIVVVIVVAALVVIFAGNSKGTGTLVLQITDQPALDIDSVLVSISSVEVHKAGFGDEEVVIEGNDSMTGNESAGNMTGNESTGSSAGWFTIVEGPVEYDLIAIKDINAFLGSEELETGKYTQIRLHVDSARALINGDFFDLAIPSKTVRIVRNFDISSGENTTLTLDFDAEQSIIRQGNNMYRMMPVVKIIEE